jgi:hypothetical protein
MARFFGEGPPAMILHKIMLALAAWSAFLTFFAGMTWPGPYGGPNKVGIRLFYCALACAAISTIIWVLT